MPIQTVINFFGTGVRYWICRIPIKEFSELSGCKEELGLDWEGVFFNLELLEKFGYKDWESIHLLDEGAGWLPIGSNWIEVRKGKKKRKILVEEFLGEGYLFDSFNKKVSVFELPDQEDIQDVVLLQVETGLVAKYIIDHSLFDLEEITFIMSPNWLSDLFGGVWIEGIEWKGRQVIKKNEDVLTRESKVMIVS